MRRGVLLRGTQREDMRLLLLLQLELVDGLHLSELPSKLCRLRTHLTQPVGVLRALVPYLRFDPLTQLEPVVPLDTREPIAHIHVPPALPDCQQHLPHPGSPPLVTHKASGRFGALGHQRRRARACTICCVAPRCRESCSS